MKLHDYEGRAVVVTGGTRGIGLAVGLAFGRQGAHVYLTHRWGSADEDEIRGEFAAAGAPEPTIVEADASQDEDTEALLSIVEQRHDAVDAFVSNVAVVGRGEGTMAHRCRSLLTSLDYSAWPLVSYLHAMKRVFGRYPRYVVAMSSDGPDTHYPGYDYVALSKAVLETFVRYMAVHLRDERVHVNALRARQVITDSYVEIFGEEQLAMARRFPELVVSVEEVANTTLALCSGLLDAVSGFVLTLDRGSSFVDNLMTAGQMAAALEEGKP